MLRLRAYEKLQELVREGTVKKTGGKYKGVASAMVVFKSQLKALRAEPFHRLPVII